MSIQGIVTNGGVTGAQLAANNNGFEIIPTKFSVSNVLSALDPTRTSPNSGVFYQAPISSRVVVDYNTVKFVCTVPPGVIPPNTTQNIREMYIFGTQNSIDFLFAIGQPTPAVIYDPSGSVTLELQISLTNVDLSSIIQFSFTQATEISEHVTDPNAHPEYIKAMNLNSIYLPNGYGGEAFRYSGQHIDQFAEWGGNYATNTYGGVTFTATHTGTDGNSINLVFDGIKTTDQVRAVWNNANPYNTLEHNGTGLEVLAAGNLTLFGGTLTVADGDVVYKDTDGLYKQALADGSLKSNIAGIADFTGPSKRVVRCSGFIGHDTTGFSEGDGVYLSSTLAGKITNVSTSIKIGTVISDGLMLIGIGSGSGGTAEGFDAVVTDSLGFKMFPTTQQAIDAVSSGSKILVDKLEYVQNTIDTDNKRIDFYFNGPETGWSKYLGTAELQHIDFSSVPTSGTWRIEWNSQTTTDLAYNASAGAVQTAMNLLTGPGMPVTVTGNYTTGFDIQWTTLVDVPQITFNDLGQNAIQTLNLGNIPDDGTIRLNYNGNNTANLAWNDNAAILETYLEAVTGISDVTVTGSFGIQQYTIQWVGVDGKTPKNALTVDANTLNLSGSATSANISVVQAGRYPASNLKVGASPVTITVATLQGGTPVGPGTCITVTENYTRFIGLGKVENFDNGIDLNGALGTEIEMLFNGTVVPYIDTGLTPNKDFHTQRSFGINQQKIRTVGTYGDHPTLWAAVTAANSGDKIVVMEDQTLTSAKVVNKDVDILFVHGSKINVTTALSGNLITLGASCRTQFMKVVVSVAGNYDTIFLLSGTRGYHEGLELESSNAAVTVDKAFRIDSGASAVYCHGVLSRGASIVNTGFQNDSGFTNHDILIRDVEGGTVYTNFVATDFSIEIPTGLINGINQVFTLSQTPSGLVLPMIDGYVVKPSEFNITGTTLTFIGVTPNPAQDVQVVYFPLGNVITPPRHLEVLDNNTSILFNSKKINFGTNLSVTLDSPEQVTINASGGGASFEVVYHTVSPAEITAKQFLISPTPLDPTKVVVDVLSLGPKAPGDDFQITGGNVFDWNGLGLDGLIASGDKVRLQYTI